MLFKQVKVLSACCAIAPYDNSADDLFSALAATVCCISSGDVREGGFGGNAFAGNLLTTSLRLTRSLQMLSRVVALRSREAHVTDALEESHRCADQRTAQAKRVPEIGPQVLFRPPRSYIAGPSAEQRRDHSGGTEDYVQFGYCPACAGKPATIMKSGTATGGNGLAISCLSPGIIGGFVQLMTRRGLQVERWRHYSRAKRCLRWSG